MAKLNLLTSIQVYKDSSPTNNPLQSTANWTNSQIGVEVSEPETKNLKIQPQQSEVLFSGVVPTDANNTTLYSIQKKVGVSNIYILSAVGGTLPNFRQNRGVNANNTTQITISKSGALMTLTHSGGTAPNFSNLQFGDILELGNSFDVLNRGKFKILSYTSNTVTVENYAGVVEVVTLANGNDLIAYSANGVQVGQKVKIGANFAGYTRGVYEITDVGPNHLEFNSAKGIPAESNVLASIVVYKNSKSFLYIEYDKVCSLTINGVERSGLKPLSVGAKKAAGFVLEVSDMYSAEIKNESTDVMNVLLISAE
jgi:hypothetical protein